MSNLSKRVSQKPINRRSAGFALTRIRAEVTMLIDKGPQDAPFGAKPTAKEALEVLTTALKIVYDMGDQHGT